ncbi:MAG: histidine--tRNA ligase [Candidatus Omnitrophica bacterium]|nr:histidine--tRNA ligase [Candidatus Omnitrophota bacterium]
MKYQALKGMSDILPGEVRKWQFVEKRTRHFLESRGFQEIRTPILEQTELFQRTIGEASDIVHKEMYTFEDRGGRSLTLRPEMTAGVARAAIEHHLLRSGIERLYYMGPMFRAERPQAGRRRQFHQIGAEILGAGGAEQDLELLLLADGLLKYLGVPGVRIKVNNLGSRAERQKYENEIRKYFSGHEKELCADCKFRLEKNVLRIFDCKVEDCQGMIERAPKMVLDISEKHFQEVLHGLKQEGVDVIVDHRIVRGLDYYNFCVFEVTAEGLGSQDAICAGGRYDGLLKDLGGQEGGACGFALGVERLLMALSSGANPLEKMMSDRTVYFASSVGFPGARERVTNKENEILLKLIESGIRVIVGKRTADIREHLKKANEAHARFCLIRGSVEASKKKVAVKDLASRIQEEIDEDKIVEYFLSKEIKSR